MTKFVEGNAVSLIKVRDYLHYIIRFENSGSALVNTVVLKDFIDYSKFDIAKLERLNRSHSFYTKISADNTTEFILENIDLSLDKINYSGYVPFKIETAPAIINTNQLTSSSPHYFDYNQQYATSFATANIQAIKS